jgi:diguanylate cyclase (GGDEF)-like protein
VTTPSRKFGVIAGIATLYFLTGKLGLTLAFVHPSATAVWPPTGIALASFLVFGYEVWPAVLLGAFLVNIATTGTVPVCLGIAVGNTFEGLAGAYLLNQFARGRHFLERTQDILKFAVLAGMLSTMISATFGVTSLCLGHSAHWADYTDIWATWWLGDAVGAFVVTPLILLWIANPRLRWNWLRALEAAILFTGLALTALIVFGVLFIGVGMSYPLEYLCIPFLMWAALRFGTREAATATLVLAVTAILGTMQGHGPFTVASKNASFFLLQAFIGVVAVMAISLAALFEERQQAEAQARLMAVSDPLTGLGNYRRLIDTVEAEVRRSDRTGRSFALLLMDLDGLKQINDTHGHLVGSRALCRFAQILRTHSRSIDTAARHGGDEFALIIPEANEQAALQVAQRIAQRLTEDAEKPPLSVSIGAAVWPRDGETIELLLRSADGALYETKRRHHAEANVPKLHKNHSER